MTKRERLLLGKLTFSERIKVRDGPLRFAHFIEEGILHKAGM